MYREWTLTKHQTFDKLARFCLLSGPAWGALALTNRKPVLGKVVLAAIALASMVAAALVPNHWKVKVYGVQLGRGTVLATFFYSCECVHTLHRMSLVAHVTLRV
jgi:hypothetical protein